MSPKTFEALEQAITDLKRAPDQKVTLHVDGLDVELRVLPAGPISVSAADIFREIGPWEGETTEQILQILEETRRSGTARPVGRL